jgi:predicted nucleotidyltransferase
MSMYTVDELKRCLYPLFQQYGVRSAVLFGSYSKGTATTRSDVDLLVDSGLKGLRFVGFLDAVKTALGDIEVDLFDTSHIEKNSLIDTEISRTGVKIYEK